MSFSRLAAAVTHPDITDKIDLIDVNLDFGQYIAQSNVHEH